MYDLQAILGTWTLLQKQNVKIAFLIVCDITPSSVSAVIGSGGGNYD
jgi:hypothetical protein